MWEFILKWGLILILMVGGSCLFAGCTLGLFRSLKKVFGWPRIEPVSGVFSLLSLSVFSAVGGFFWLLGVLEAVNRGEEYLEIPLLFYGFIINGLAGLLLAGFGSEVFEDCPNLTLRMISVLASSTNIGMIVGLAMLEDFADPFFSSEQITLIGSLLGGSLGILIGMVVAWLLYKKDDFLRKFVGKDYEKLFGSMFGVFGCWFVGSILGSVFSGAANMTLAIWLEKGVLYAPFGIFLGTAAAFFVGVSHGIFGVLFGVPFAFVIWKGLEFSIILSKELAERFSRVMIFFLECI